MTAKKQKLRRAEGQVVGSPKPMRQCVIRGKRFFTSNHFAVDEFTGQHVWFAEGMWSYDGGDPGTLHSSLVGAVAAAFDLDVTPLWKACIFREPPFDDEIAVLQADVDAAWAEIGGDRVG